MTLVFEPMATQLAQLWQLNMEVQGDSVEQPVVRVLLSEGGLSGEGH